MLPRPTSAYPALPILPHPALVGNDFWNFESSVGQTRMEAYLVIHWILLPFYQRSWLYGVIAVAEDELLENDDRYCSIASTALRHPHVLS